MEEKNEMNVPEEYKPISPIGYIGYSILFALPLIGWIFVLVFGLSKNGNKNRKNLAMAYIIIWVITIVLSIIGWVVLEDAIFDILHNAYVA